MQAKFNLACIVIYLKSMNSKTKNKLKRIKKVQILNKRMQEMMYDSSFRYTVLSEIMNTTESTIYNYILEPSPTDIDTIQYEDLYM